MSRRDKIRALLSDWLRDSPSIQLFMLFTDQNQAQLEQLCRSDILNLKVEKQQGQFIQWVKQNSLELKEERYGKMEQRPMENDDEVESLKSKLKEYLQTLQIKDNEKKNVDSLIQIKLNQQFNMMAQRKLKQNMETLSISCFDKFRNNFNKIFKIYYVKEDSSFAQRVLESGTLQTLRLKLKDQKRENIQKTIEMMRSYQDLEKYGGNDINKMRQQVEFQLVECLLQLQIPLNLIQEIKIKLLSQPTSNCVANMKQLSEETKKKYYESKFYKSNILHNYSQQLYYSQTIYASAMKEISKITQFISGKVKIQNEIMELLLNFELEEVLKNSTVQHLKKEIFILTKNQCPTFFRGCQLVKYLKKQPKKDFTTNMKKSKIFHLRNKFIEANLRYQTWENVQTQLFLRNDSIIHNLELKIQQKNLLRKFYNEVIQPFFHQQEKPFSYEQQIREILLSEIIQSKLQKGKELETLHSFIDAVIKLNVLDQSKIDDTELTPKEKTQLVTILKKNDQFLKYMNNKGKDVAEIQYKACQLLKKLIYQINLQNNIEVSYQSIQEFLQFFKINQLNVPKQFKRYVCDLMLLTKRYKEENGGPSQEQLDQLRLKQLKEQKSKVIDNFWRYLVSKCTQESYIMRQFDQKFQNKHVEFSEILLKLNPFQDGRSKLAQLQIQKTATEKYINNEAKAMNDPQFQSYVKQYKKLTSEIREILKEENDEIQKESVPESPMKPVRMMKQETSSSQKQQSGASSRQMNEPLVMKQITSFNRAEQPQNLQRRMEEIQANFLQKYATLDNPEESLFRKNILNKHPEKINNIIKIVLEANPFEKIDPSFADVLKANYGVNKLQAQNIQKEFKEKAASFGKEMANEYISLIANLKNIQ